MTEIDAEAKKWGNSVGIILPKDLGIKPNEKLRISVQRRNKTRVKDIFGLLKGKFNKPTSELMREIDRDLDSKI